VAGSFPVFDRVAEHLIGRISPTHALDIGAGAGKYGRMLRSAAPACDCSAIEIEPASVSRHGLDELYWRVEIADAGRWWRDNPDEVFDLIVIGDCLQQMPKSEGLDLLNAMTYRCAWILAVAPEFVVQGAVDGHASAVHRSVWSERDFHWHDLWAWDNTRSTSLFLLRGYLPSALDIDAVVDGLDRAGVPLLDLDGQTSVRPCRLRLVDHRREVAYRPR
jgi:hypothetical protein